MEEILRALDGKRVDINCGTGAIFRGTLKEIGDQVITIIDEDDRYTSIAIRKVIAVTECVEPLTRPGFIV